MPTDSSLPFQSNKSEQTSYYDLLQVSQKADPEIIEAAYRRLALKFHPDHNADPQATGQMQALNEAYNVLKDATRRAEYDRELKRAFFTDDLTDDDYEYPARRRSIRAGWAERLSGLAVVGGLALVLFLWLAGRDSNATDKTDPTAVQSPRPTVALPPGTLLADDFESVGSANWRLDQPWHLTTRYAHSGKNSLWFGDEGRGHYGPNVSAAATLVRPLALGEGQPILNFWLSGQSDRDEMPTGEDRLFVEAARPGLDFQTIFTANGLYSSWQEISLDLSRWKGQAILFRFRFSSGALNSGAGFSGFFVDDVRVTN